MWDKFAKETRIFGKNVKYFETCSENLQQETIEWFFAQLWDEIQNLSRSAGRSWKSAVEVYFERLGRQMSLADAATGRRKYLGADKWKASVGLTQRQVKP